MNQLTFSDMEYSGRKRVTQKEKFLREMNDIIPWADWVNKILPYYPKGKRGRPPYMRKAENCGFSNGSRRNLQND